MSYPAVYVGSTDYPLRSPASCPGGPLPCLGRGKRPFLLLDGPPYANGEPHLGHVLNKHLKDAMARANGLLGHDVQWRPGWDCHGLPVELAVEKQGAERSNQEKFVAQARQYAREQSSLQEKVFRKQGWSAQWDQPWRTMDPGMEAGTMRVLADLLDAGHLRMRFAAVPWCPVCQSTLSMAEQEDRPFSRQAWVVPFELDDGSVLLSWTTTPWTLPLHRALFVHPKAPFVQLQKRGLRAWVSKETAAHWSQVLGAQVMASSCMGQDLVGCNYKTPWAQGVVRCDESVVPGAGTGVLHAVPGLSDLDTQLGQVHGLGFDECLGPDGVLSGSPCQEQDGSRAGSPASLDPVRLAYGNGPWHLELRLDEPAPHCWRHHVPLLTRPSRQLFFVLDEMVRQRAHEYVQQMKFTPEKARERLLTAMVSRPDWCLSRQRTWGVPTALFLDADTGQPHALASTWMRRVAEDVEREGVEAWWRYPVSRWVKEVDECQLVQTRDVLDVWFDSGCVPQLLGQADLVVEGTDQYRGWFQSCLWVAAGLDAAVPFKRVVSHGFVLGPDGAKLSKSKGGDKANGKVPAWSSLPSDVVRVWALSGGEGLDKAWSESGVANAQSLVMRLRGVVRFLLANALSQPCNLSPASLCAWDRYWWSKSHEMAGQVVQLCAQGRTGEAVARVAPFAEQFSAWCLGAWKDRLYCAAPWTRERQELDLAVRGCLLAWGQVAEVLAPRARAQAQPFWPPMEACDVPHLGEDEQRQVEQVLALRLQLGPCMELFSKAKMPPSSLRLHAGFALPNWPGQLLADALGLGQLGEFVPTLDQCHVDAGQAWLGVSPDPACPRCRRPQPAWQGSCCSTCQQRTSPDPG